MCGIAGIFTTSKASRRVRPGEAILMRDQMATRGPDGQGLFYDGDGVALVHRRLSILDLSDCGRQPMTTPDGRYTITFNGEVYNFKRFQDELKAQGVVFRSGSDTEVLLHLYARDGLDFLRELRGMFAIGIWDRDEKRLVLATDPFGIKPIYYSWSDGTLRFASQVSALLRCPDVDTSVEPAGHAGFFLWGSVPEPYTFYKGIRHLGAGGLMVVENDGRMEASKWIRIRDELASASEAGVGVPEAEMRERLRASMSESMRHHLVSDVPVSVFLSCGLDSTTLAAHARECADETVRTVTLGFKEFEGKPGDEAPLAEHFARAFGTDHQTVTVSGASFSDDLPALMRSMDQPSIDAINTYFVSKATASTGAKVAISGLGGDELFGSYDSFTQVPKAVRSLGWSRNLPPLGKAFRALSKGFFAGRQKPKMAGLLEYGNTYGGAYLLRRALFMPWEMDGLIDPGIAREGLRELDTLNRLDESVQGIKSTRLMISSLEAEWYMRNMLLRDSDWTSMAHSLELRTPLVDIDLWRQVAPLLAAHPEVTKRDMARTTLQPLPDEILNRKKSGFGIPLHDWIKGQAPTLGRESALRAWAREVYATYQEVRPTPATEEEMARAYRAEGPVSTGI